MDVVTVYTMMAAIVAVCAALAIVRFRREPDPRAALRRNLLASLPVWLYVVALFIAPKPYNPAYVLTGVILAGVATLAIYTYLRKRERGQ